MEHAIRDRLVLLLTNGMTIEAAEGYCVRQDGMNLDTAGRTVAGRCACRVGCCSTSTRCRCVSWR